MAVDWMDFSTTDPKTMARQNRQWIASTGQGLMDQNAARSIQEGQQAYGHEQDAAGTQGQLSSLLDPTGTKSKLDSYLDPGATTSRLDSWMSPLASGQGGYNSDELSQIKMTPQQQQDMVTKAGVSAGLRNSAATGAADRAAASAGGGNPLAVAAYRARAAQQGASDAGDAMTSARVATSDAAANRAENIGGTRIGQQNTGLNYYNGLQGEGTNYLTNNLNQGTGFLNSLQQQQTTQAENARTRGQQDLDRQSGAYGTSTGGLTGSTNTAETASMNPTLFDKLMSAAGGAMSALEDGDVMPAAKTPAVVGENGPEKVVSTRRNYMDDGGIAGISGIDDDDSSGGSAPGGFAGFLNRLKLAFQQQPNTSGGTQPPTMQNPQLNSANVMGKAAGMGARYLMKLLEDGDVMPEQGSNGVFTKPTRVNLSPGEAVVPLTYRATAKVRPSKAALPAAPITYRARGGSNGIEFRPV